jgi:hypothetical protein
MARPSGRSRLQEARLDVRERNAAVEPFDAAVLEAFGMTSFATRVPGKRK